MKNLLFFPATVVVGCLMLGMFAISGITGCHHKPEYDTSIHIEKGSYVNSREKHPLVSKADTEVVVWKNPKATDANFKIWLNNRKGLVIRDSSFCKHCGDELIILKGPNVNTIIVDKAASAGITGTDTKPSGGGDDTAFFSYNINVNLPEPYDSTKYDGEDSFAVAKPPLNATNPIIVAVFDTGLDPAAKGIYTSAVSSCMTPHGKLGWNYIKDMDDTKDDDAPIMHGSRVSRFVINEATTHTAPVKLNVLPVKVHDDSGRGDLFHVLCGFAYAANSGVKIINASFGFYSADPDHAPALLKNFVQHYLTEKNILLIAAAGNQNHWEDSAFRVHNVGKDERNLEFHPFYPACLAKELPNVFVVTTVAIDSGRTSRDQNYSPDIVDIGVQCDGVTTMGNYWFFNPIHSNVKIFGSSYATPVITGKLAKFYTQLLPASGLFDKPTILNKMEMLSIIKKKPALAAYVKKGYFSVK